MHRWGDEDFDWKALDDAIKIIRRVFLFWGVPVLQIKEKWGTVRVYVGGFGWSSFFNMMHPDYVYYKWTKPVMVIDRWIGRTFLWNLLVHRPSAAMHAWAYVRAYRKAVEAHPDLAAEILGSADCRELLKGIVPVEDCDHGQVWTQRKKDEDVETHECGICGKALTASEFKAYMQKDEGELPDI